MICCDQMFWQFCWVTALLGLEVLLAYPTSTACFQCGLLKNDPYKMLTDRGHQLYTDTCRLCMLHFTQISWSLPKYLFYLKLKPPQILQCAFQCTCMKYIVLHCPVRGYTNTVVDGVYKFWRPYFVLYHLSTISLKDPCTTYKGKNKRATGAVNGARPFWLKMIGLDEPGATFEKKWVPVTNLLFSPPCTCKKSDFWRGCL